MFVIIEKYRTPAQIILGAIGLSFIGFGAAQFSTTPNNQYIVKIGDQVITRYNLDNAMRNMEAQGGSASREAVLRELMNRAYFIEGAKLMGISVSDAQVKQRIVDNKIFHDANGKFSPDNFKKLLESNNISEKQFMDSERESLMLEAMDKVLSSNVIADAQIQQILNATMAERTIRNVGLNPQAFADKVKVDDAELKKFYEANKKAYTLPQAIKFEYVRFSPKTLAEKENVSEDELNQAIKEAQSQPAGKRQIAHILIPYGDDKAKSKAEADKIAQEAQANPQKFAELAKQYSQDPDSAKNGGVIGEFSANGDLINAAFKAAAFGVKSGEVSQVVESDFGYHIIKAEAVGDNLANQVDKDAIRQQVQEKKAQQSYAKLREDFGDAALSNSDNLKTSADKFKLPLQSHTEWLTRESAPAANIPNVVVDALFNDEVFAKKHNSEAISADGETWFVRAIETRAEAAQPFDAVKERVKEDYIRSESARLAKEQAQTFVKDLQAGKEVALAWSPAQSLAPEQIRGALSPEAYKTVMTTAPKDKKPAYVLVDNLGSPQIIEIQAIKPINLAENKQILTMMKQVLAQQTQRNVLSEAYLDYLSKQIKTEQGIEKISDSE